MQSTTLIFFCTGFKVIIYDLNRKTERGKEKKKKEERNEASSLYIGFSQPHFRFTLLLKYGKRSASSFNLPLIPPTLKTIIGLGPLKCPNSSSFILRVNVPPF